MGGGMAWSSWRLRHAPLDERNTQGEHAIIQETPDASLVSRSSPGKSSSIFPTRSWQAARERLRTTPRDDDQRISAVVVVGGLLQRRVLHYHVTLDDPQPTHHQARNRIRSAP